MTTIKIRIGEVTSLLKKIIRKTRGKFNLKSMISKTGCQALAKGQRNGKASPSLKGTGLTASEESVFHKEIAKIVRYTLEGTSSGKEGGKSHQALTDYLTEQVNDELLARMA